MKKRSALLLTVITPQLWRISMVTYHAPELNPLRISDESSPPFRINHKPPNQHQLIFLSSMNHWSGINHQLSSIPESITRQCRMLIITYKGQSGKDYPFRISEESFQDPQKNLTIFSGLAITLLDYPRSAITNRPAIKVINESHFLHINWFTSGSVITSCNHNPTTSSCCAQVTHSENLSKLIKHTSWGDNSR